MTGDKCYKCGKNMSIGPGIYTEMDGKQVLLCDSCWNKYISEMMGLDFKTIKLNPITLQDCEGKPHTFQFFTQIVPSGLYVEAIELKEDNEIGYKFSVLGSQDCSQEDLIIDLYQKIKKGISLKYLEKSELGRQIKNMKVTGRIEWDDDFDGKKPVLIIDGERVSWNEFGKILMSYEGWNFTLNILDKTEDIN